MGPSDHLVGLVAPVLATTTLPGGMPPAYPIGLVGLELEAAPTGFPIGEDAIELDGGEEGELDVGLQEGGLDSGLHDGGFDSGPHGG